MIEKIFTLWPEITLFAFTCVVMILGLSRSLSVRRLCAPLSAAALAIAGVLALTTTPDAKGALPHLPLFVKVLTCAVGLVLLLQLAGTADRGYETRVARGEAFDPLRSTRAEFYAFFLFSLTGLMLCGNASDLIWLFLALELTSLPTYVMVAISADRNSAKEAAVKYFFLGALGAATFLYGFALIYGGTGTTDLQGIHAALSQQMATGGINSIAMAGLVLSVIGIAFKIAAVPMHFYTPDVYQGSSSGVASMLAFVPKTAGFVALILVLATVGWVSTSPAAHGQLPEPLHSLLWIMAALTMTVGNVLAVMQNSIKRMLGYSSVAHSGYMLVALLAGPGPEGASLTRNGLSAVLFYLIVYAVANLGCFAVLGCLEKTTSDGKSEEIDHIDDIRGLISTRPLLAWVMAVCSLSLLGLPPLLGFMGKLPIFSTGLAAGEIVLVVILGLNSAIAAYYYIRIAKNAILEQSPVRPAGEEIRDAAVPARQFAGIIAGLGTVVLAIIPISSLAIDGGTFRHSRSGVTNSPAQTLPAPVGSAEPATADAPTGPVADATVPPTIAR